MGLCNADEIAREVVASWRDLDVSGKQRLRDVWRQLDLGGFDAEFTATVPRHGVVLVRVIPGTR